MTEIQKGDWVYWRSEDGRAEEVFQCVDAKYTRAYDTPNSYFENCHRLTPLKPGEAKIGDRVAVIVKIDSHDPEAWTITRIAGTWSVDKHPTIEEDGYKEGRPVWLRQLARLPDCAQDKPITVIPIEEDKLDSIPKAPKDKQIRMEVLGRKKPTPCPHPEWLGLWEDKKERETYKIYWLRNQYHAECSCASLSKRFDAIGWDAWSGPREECWLQIEPAPTTSTAGPKLSRPQKHGGVKTPVDTW